MQEKTTAALAKALAAEQLPFVQQEVLAGHTTFKIGGPAAFWCAPRNAAELRRILQHCRVQGVRVYLLGNGSNTLFADEGYDGAVIDLRGLNFGPTAEPQPDGSTHLTAGAGLTLGRLCAVAQQQSLAGLAFACGIPGTIGGAVYMNAGAYGGEMKDVLTEITVMDEEGEIVTLPADKLELGYRTSIIKTAGYIVLEAKLQLKEGNPEVIRETMKDLTIRRTTKQPLEYPSAGSTFKRPEGYFAGKLIMDSGLAGYQVGGAQVSEKHCGFVINAGGATARDVRTLMDNVRDIVYKKYGVTLEPEVKFLGDFEA